MKRLIDTACCVLVVIAARFADAHGTPILVGPAGDALVASGGLSDDAGFAPQIFVEDDEDGDPFASLVLPNVGPVIVWQIPGFNISGLDEQSSLSIEVLARPVKDSNPVEERILWYWNAETELGVASSPMNLLGTGARFTTLDPLESVAPPSFLLTSSMVGQQGFHNHGLLSYGLDNDPQASPGAYGFFARLTSNQDATPSNPFLIVFNYGVDYEQMVAAALAINAAAVDSLPGDYNDDGSVDAADYIVWRHTPALDIDYLVWQENFGRTSPAASTFGMTHVVVPEPATLLLVACAMAWVATGRVRLYFLHWCRHFANAGR